MGKVAKSIEEQIQILRERGMYLDFEDDKIKEFLLDIGYYRLGFYWYPFQKTSSDDFVDGTKFSDVISLYYLDVDLRYLLIKYINRLELNFRTNLIYWASMKYVDNPVWFATKGIMKHDYLKVIKSHYNKKFKEKNIQIKKHHENHEDDEFAPAWKTFEYYTFGSIVKVYENIVDESLRKDISLKYGIKKTDKFQNYLDAMVFVRNSCAHSGVIFDLHIDEGVSELPTVKFNNGNSHNLDAAIKALMYLMNHISSNRKNDLEDSIGKLFNDYIDNEFIKRIITDKIGYEF
jgi:abortive infection bacteriophage resistance protein